MPSESSPPRQGETVLEVQGLRKVFAGKRGAETVAVADVDFTLRTGECLAVVGESGSGKSTLARTVLRLIEPTAGRVVYRGTDLLALDRRALRAQRRHLQMIFQDPYASLHPRQTVYRIVSEPWRVHRDLMPARPRDRVAELLEQVGMPASAIDAHPAQLSGGQRQRVSIARALGLKPDVLVLDEPVSALDVSIQAQVITLLMELQEELGLSYLFISHDLALVRLVATRVAVMYRGEFVEFGTTEQIFDSPQAEYTRTLLGASPALAELAGGGEGEGAVSALEVVVWGENRHEQIDQYVRDLYPEGMHEAIAAGVRGILGDRANVTTATLEQPEHGLSEERLQQTDVLTWWGHKAHGEVSDEIVDRVHRHVLDGMGLLVLHSGHFSKIFKRLMGTSCTLNWRATGDEELVWTVEPSHPIAEGVPHPIRIPAQEMYGERFDIPAPDELVFLSTFSGGEVFRSGCTFRRGNGKIFFFSPGDQHFPVYRHPDVLRVISNGVRWAAGERSGTTPANHRIDSREDWGL